ncbi:MAG TPA: prealbumin-like fold domain-containing protein [Nocardioidaceae bacterium]
MRQTQTPAAGRTRRRLATIGAGVLAVALIPSLAFASHPEASLPGSNFEIDVDANLKVDDPAPPSLDWANVTEIRATDAVNGTGDDSYAGGVKEDTECPAETTDSIPPNKSDLLSFHVYEEAGTGGHPGFLNLAWSRVSEPSGTTLMDFEFNQSETPCASGPNVVRTAGDLLIEYAIDQGGARAEISARTWTGSAWGPSADLDVPSTTCPDSNDDPAPCAAGTINDSPIPAAESDGLIESGEKEARTFGEAQLDLRLIFQADQCSSFGSAMLKSRSSDAFTSQLKDFVAPVPIDLQNCGNVIIRKQTDPDEDPNATDFGYTKDFATDPVSADTFTLKDDGVQDYEDTVLFGSDYTVTEDVIPDNWEFVSLDCSASSAGTAYSVDGATVTFSIDSDTDELDCTYTNKLNLGAIEITKTRKHAADGPGDHAHAGVDFTVTGTGLPAAGVTVTTGASGTACVDGLAFGGFTVVESVPAGYVSDDASKDVTVDNAATCSDDPFGGETVSFHNTPLTNVTVSVDSQVVGGTASTIECTDSEGNPYSGSTGANGDGSLTVSDLLPTDPTVTLTCEITVDP